MSYTGSATIHWAMSTDADLAGYKVYQGVLSGVYTRTQALGLITCSTGQPGRVVDQIVNGAANYIALTAYDTSLNESLFSAEIVITKSIPLLTLLRQL